MWQPKAREEKGEKYESRKKGTKEMKDQIAAIIFRSRGKGRGMLERMGCGQAAQFFFVFSYTPTPPMRLQAAADDVPTSVLKVVMVMVVATMVDGWMTLEEFEVNTRG
eukprot:GHVU01004405.1.p3 GENE.GHVU01004405.1~~GHVU01004405.1.p3  ORF type:complete len:108 (+),score=21.52 GHVU01004405.1:1044-1367(+)